MAEFLTTSGVASSIERIIKDAGSTITLVCPYVRLPVNLFERLKAADQRDVKTILLYGKDELKDDQKKLLSQLANLELLYYKNLHAKCYYNERHMVITSMNLVEFSEKTNREIGVLLSIDQDEKVFRKAEEEVGEILGNATKVPLKRRDADGRSRGFIRRKAAKHSHGFCIRCGEAIKYNRAKPLCDNCYDVWDRHNNPLYHEKRCHKCGKTASTSKQYPLCQPCALKEELR